MRWPAKRLAFTPKLRVQLKDRKVHTARIVFLPPVLSVFLDGSVAPVLETVVDFSIAADRQGGAWVGFTASTGLGCENHDILNWSFAGTDVSSSMSWCLPTSRFRCRHVCQIAICVRQSAPSSSTTTQATKSFCPPIWNGARVSPTRPGERCGDQRPRHRLLGPQGARLGRVQRAFRERTRRRRIPSGRGRPER